MRGHVAALFAFILALSITAATSAVPQGDATVRQAASILAEKCLKCHDSAKRSGGVDLTTRASAAVVLGGAARSRLVRAVSEGRMPPSGKLPPDEIVLLRTWVTGGARYIQPKLEAETAMSPTLWSFQPVRQPPIPKIQNPGSKVQNPIDAFVLKKLTEKGLTPAPPADRLTLLRRVTVDLTGLPPTLGEVSSFLHDRSPNAYEKVVNRLLASPAYGERWARHWLDVVRFGESNGYEQNHIRPNAWPYRDWVIRSFNEDKPYDRFVMEQLAGDVLAKDDPAANAGTGFIVAGIHDTVGIQEEEGTRQQRINDLEDIVSTTGAAFLGLTVGCARCHDHKFDPVPQRDFYRLAACFAGVRHGERPLDPRGPSQTEMRAMGDLQNQITERATQVNALDAAARVRILATRGQTGLRAPVAARWNSDLFPACPARFVRFTVLATTDGAEPCLDELQVFGPGSKENLALASRGAKATASGVLPGFVIHQIAHLNDGQFGNEHSWISNERGRGWAQIELNRAETVSEVMWSRDGAEIPRFDDRLPSAYRIEVSLDGNTWTTVSTEKGRAGSSDYVHPDALMKAMTAEERAQRARLKTETDDLKRRLEALRSSQSAYIGQFTKPDPTYVLRRGDVMQRQGTVLPGALSKVAGLDADLVKNDAAPEPERRLALARWITDPRNPLTARVMVNRIWQHHFGRGIVGTPSDFGRNGERPTHPELLDWLASDFMEHGWRMKRLHKLMVMSEAYQRSAGGSGQKALGRRTIQSTKSKIQNEAIDGGNLYLWRMPLQRMEAEAVRDAILQTSGKLDRRMGGPGYQLFQYTVVNVAIYQPKEEYGPETWRRGVYSQAARAIRDSLMGTLDCPECSQRAPKRDSTTTALQALSLLNGPFVLQQAGFFAERVRAKEGPDAGRQADLAFQLAVGRSPNAVERKAAVALVRDEGLPALCRALMNANEFLYY